MRRALLLPLLTIALATAGCGADDHPGADRADRAPQVREQHARTPAGSVSASATPTTTPAAPTAPPVGHRSGQPGGHAKSRKTAPPIPTRRNTPGAHLLNAERLPGLGRDLTWTLENEGPEGDHRVGACQKTALSSIGALSAVRRDFTADASATATQVVATFADAKSAWRAHEVLGSWRADCASRLDYPRARVGELRDVSVASGHGDSYRATYGPRSATRGRAAGLGIVRHGAWLSIIEVVTAVADYPESPGHRDPVRVAVRRVARSFG